MWLWKNVGKKELFPLNSTLYDSCSMMKLDMVRHSRDY